MAEPAARADRSPLGCSGSAFRWASVNYFEVKYGNKAS
jgi:hypothetical protein